MRMSGLCKVEMSAFIGGRGPHGNGANRLEPTRTGEIAGATRGQAEADRSRQTPNPADYIRAIQQSLTDGKKFLELIAVEGQYSELILVEGHSRATAYVACRWNEGIKVFLTSSPSMHDWAYLLATSELGRSMVIVAANFHGQELSPRPCEIRPQALRG
jgi:hypothetical protein